MFIIYISQQYIQEDNSVPNLAFPLGFNDLSDFKAAWSPSLAYFGPPLSPYYLYSECVSLRLKGGKSSLGSNNGVDNIQIIKIT